MIRRTGIVLFIALLIALTLPATAFADSPAIGTDSQMGSIWGKWSAWLDFEVLAYYQANTPTTWKVYQVNSKARMSHTVLKSYIDNCYVEIRQGGVKVLDLNSGPGLGIHTLSLSSYTHKWAGLSKVVTRNNTYIYNFYRYRYPNDNFIGVREGTKALRTEMF